MIGWIVMGYMVDMILAEAGMVMAYDENGRFGIWILEER